MGNDFVGEEYKDRLRKAAKTGRDGQTQKQSTHKTSCAKEFPCLQLDNRSNNQVQDIIPKVAPKQVKKRRNH